MSASVAIARRQVVAGHDHTPPWAGRPRERTWVELERWVSARPVALAARCDSREPTVWEQYGSYLAAGVTSLLQSGADRRAFGVTPARPALGTRDGVVVVEGDLMCTVRATQGLRELHVDVIQRLGAGLGDRCDPNGRPGPSMSADGATRSIRDGLIKLSEGCSCALVLLAPSVIEDLGVRRGLKSRMRPRDPFRSRHGAVQRGGRSAETASGDTALCLFRVAQGGTAQRRPTCRRPARSKSSLRRWTADCSLRSATTGRFRRWQTRRAAEPRTPEHQERVACSRARSISTARKGTAQRRSHGCP